MRRPRDEPCAIPKISDPLSDGPVVEGTLSGASAFQSSCGGKGLEAAFLWTAPLSGAYSFDATASQVENAITVLRPGARCKGNELLCRATGTFLVYTAMASETVEIVVDSTGAQGGFALTITGPAQGSMPSSGDGCAEFDLGSSGSRPAETTGASAQTLVV